MNLSIYKGSYWPRKGVGKVRFMALSLFGLLVCSLFSEIAVARDDPIEVLWSGDAGSLGWDALYIAREPMIDAVLFPGGRCNDLYTVLEARRETRRYFPRTYQDLVDDYECIVLKNWDSPILRPIWFEWMRKAIEEQGMAALTEGSVNDHKEIGHLSFWDAFPDDAVAVLAAQVGDSPKGLFTIIINEDPNLPPVLTRYSRLLNLEYRYWWTCFMVPRQGATVYAWAKTGVRPMDSSYLPGVGVRGTWPFVMGWRYGKGYTWCVGATSSLCVWRGEYGPDAYFSMVLYGTGRGLPEDVVMVHKLKRRFGEYSEKQGFIISMMEFVEKFGADTNSLMVKVIAMDERWGEARRLYIGQDYGGSWSLFDQLLADIDAFTMDALTLKDKTLFWVYATEWCVITATLLLSGFLLWSLMVGRRLYRMAGQTRLRPPPGGTGSEYPVYLEPRPHTPWWKRTGEHSGLAIS